MNSALLIGIQAYELATLTGTQLLLLVVSETGIVYTFTTPNLQPIVSDDPGKSLISVRSGSNVLDLSVCRKVLIPLMNCLHEVLLK